MVRALEQFEVIVKRIKFTPSRMPVNQKVNQLTKWWPGTVVTCTLQWTIIPSMLGQKLWSKIHLMINSVL